MTQSAELITFEKYKNKLAEFENQTNLDLTEFKRYRKLLQQTNYYWNNIDKVKTRVKKHYYANKEKKLVYMSNYYYKNKKVLEGLNTPDLRMNFFQKKYNGNLLPAIEKQKCLNLLTRDFDGSVFVGETNQVVLSAGTKKQKLQPNYENIKPLPC